MLIPEFLFVYGTLRHQGIGHKIGDTKVPGRLVDVGDFPGYLPPKTPEEFVVGTLLSVPPEMLKELDRYEGVHQGLYSRVKIDCPEHKDVWVYQLNPRLEKDCIPIPHGNWDLHKKNRSEDEIPGVGRIYKGDEEGEPYES